MVSNFQHISYFHYFCGLSADSAGISHTIGCVRLWNPMWSSREPSNGCKIVEVNSDIGFFSIGDPFKEEHDLVVFVFFFHCELYPSIGTDPSYLAAIPREK